MKSPYPPFGEAVFCSRQITEKYKGEEFAITEVFWHDPISGNDFDTTETGNATVNQIYNAYRVKHGLPFPDEFVVLRKRLGWSAAKMSAVLGLGVNQYRLYEKGDMPVEAIGRYIKMLMTNNSALKDLIENAKDVLTAKEYQNAVGFAEHREESMATKMLLNARNKDNGYAPLDAERMHNVVLHFLNKLGPTPPTTLNKLLFYTDFMAYRSRGMAISGLSYRALPYGPVPDNWKYIPLIQNIDQQEAEVGTLLHATSMADYSCFTEKEVEILMAVAERFKDMKASTISSLSHQEEAWIKSRMDVKSPISFDYAFSLRGI